MNKKKLLTRQKPQIKKETKNEAKPTSLASTGGANADNAISQAKGAAQIGSLWPIERVARGVNVMRGRGLFN